MHPSLETSDCPLGLPCGRIHRVAESTSPGLPAQRAQTPLVLRGVASRWPALERWSFKHLAERGGARPVTLVAGNRELERTRFVASTFSQYVTALESGSAVAGPGSEKAHLKEFDLLKEIPELAQDIRPDGLFPRGHIVSSSAWIGPQGAHTGLHHDLLDNLAVLVRGAKRFYLARPGTVEALGALSAKYDRWARLASIGMRGLIERELPPDSLWMADLGPGDAIYVPHGWWHEVVNLQASVFLSGFFGPAPRTLGLWLATGARQLLHDCQVWGPRHCTCHPGTPSRNTLPLAAPTTHTP